MSTETATDLRARRSQVVNRHIDAENRHDPDGVVASFDQPNYDIPPFGEAGQVHGAEAVRQLWADLIAGFPDVHIEAGPHRHTDDAVFVEVTLTGTHQGEWAGIPATGRQASVRIACLYEFEEDRLVCERVWFDFATILRQLGVLAS
jgi:steroid delta-isomerase-like uncharacterized protein